MIDKTPSRKSAFARRKLAHVSDIGAGAGRLSEVLAGHRGVPLAGYMPIQTEISPLAAMEEASAYGPVGVPVIVGESQPLKVRSWSPGCEMQDGPFGASVPANGEWMTPTILIVPLVAFNRAGHRLGYGGGFYDRTLEKLRRKTAIYAIGFAYSAQEDRSLPVEATDQPLDLIVTETEIITPSDA